jgi:hypothetical protein
MCFTEFALPALYPLPPYMGCHNRTILMNLKYADVLLYKVLWVSRSSH